MSFLQNYQQKKHSSSASIKGKNRVTFYFQQKKIYSVFFTKGKQTSSPKEHPSPIVEIIVRKGDGHQAIRLHKAKKLLSILMPQGIAQEEKLIAPTPTRTA